jgi:colanic acid biosynthesis glycosyl transferase WcaI
MVERLVHKGVAPQRVRSLPNWVDVDALRPLGRPSAYRTELGIAPAAVVALFSGTLGPKQGLLMIPQVARLLAQRPEIVFVVCGDGVMKQALQEACAGLSNMILLPLQPVERLGELLGLAEVHLLTQSPGAEDLVMPSKLSGMLASGRPVVATVRQGSEIAKLLTDCGLVVAPEDAAALAAAVGQLASDATWRAGLGQAARLIAVERMGRQAISLALERELERLVDGHAPDVQT